MFLDKEFLKEVIGPYLVKVVLGFLVSIVGLSIVLSHGVAYICVASARADLLVNSLITPVYLYLPVAVGGLVITGLGYILVHRGFQEGVCWLEGRGK